MRFNKISIIILILLHQYAFAEISTDGSVGSAQILTTNDGQFSIGQELGSLRGSNLFHSFQQFNIEAGESATFTGDNSIQNVISRVTGGNESIINGILRSQVGSADFYFINPAGVTFSENAQVDVPAAFHVSSAGELVFADGSSFSAINPEASTLTVAEPEGFGFIAGQTGSLQIIGSQLAFKPGTDVSLSTNSLSIAGVEQENGDIQPTAIFVEQADPSTESGIRLNLTAVDSATTQIIPITGLAATATGGELLINNSNIDLSGNGLGRLAIRAGMLTAYNSQLSANNTGIQSMALEDGVDVYVDSLLLDQTLLTNNAISQGSSGNVLVTVNNGLQILNGGTISAATFGNGEAGNVAITAQQLTLDRQDSNLVTGISSDAKPDSGGNAGMITLVVKEAFQILNGGIVSADTFGNGNAGNILINAKQLTVDGQGNDSFTGISSDAELNSSGNAGVISIVANELLQVLNGGKINADGDTGSVVIAAGQLTLNRQGNALVTGISSDTESGDDGNAGTVTITINGALQILNGATISSDTFNNDHAGSVAIIAEQLTLDGRGSDSFTGIVSSAQSGGDGNAGSITVTVDDVLQIVNGGAISSSTLGSGDAGNIVITARQLMLDHQGSDLVTGILSDAEPDSSGDAGTVSVTVNEALQISDGGIISSISFSNGKAGDVGVSAGQLTVDGQGSDSFTGISSDVESANGGNAGIVTVTVKDTLQLINGGRINSDGNLGDVAITAEQLIIDHQDSNLITGISSDTEFGSHDNAGKVDVAINGLLQIVNGGVISSASFSNGDSGNVAITARQLIVDGRGSDSFTGISSDVESANGGNAGTVTVTVTGALELINGGRINSDGNLGDVAITAEQLTIDRQGSNLVTGISSDTEFGADDNAGSVTVTINGNLQIVNGGIISSTSFSSGDAGSVAITAGQLVVDGQDSNLFTGITSDVESANGGNTGSVAVTVPGQIILKEGGISIVSLSNVLVTNTNSDTTPPKIIIDTIDLQLKQNSGISADAIGETDAAPIEIKVAGNLVVSDSQVTTSAVNGSGGSIEINANNLMQLKRSQLTTSVFGEAGDNGGDIRIDAPVLVLDTGFIQANTEADNASGGDIDLKNVEQLITSGDSREIGGLEPLTFNREQTNFNVIQAASPDGVSGTINITSPELNIVGILTNVDTPDLDTEHIGQDPCASIRENSLRNLGRGGTPVFQHGENYLQIDRYNDLGTDPKQSHINTPHTDRLINKKIIYSE